MKNAHLYIQYILQRGEILYRVNRCGEGGVEQQKKYIKFSVLDKKNWSELFSKTHSNKSLYNNIYDVLTITYCIGFMIICI